MGCVPSELVSFDDSPQINLERCTCRGMIYGDGEDGEESTHSPADFYHV
ncbi:MAG: hypothetical protein F6K55_45670 [Moorea sp. SIO4A3]|nr:hypothetical protein [Moorena sp. SIO4A3]